MKPVLRSLFLWTLFSFVTPSFASAIDIPTLEVQADDDLEEGEVNTLSLPQEAIEQQGSISVNEFLQNQGLVQVKSQSSVQNQSGISIRGFGENASSNSLILINGIPLTSFTHIGPDLNSLLVENIKRIEISPGSFGSLYGDQAIGGVVNIITQIPEKNTAKFQLAAGNQSQKLADALWSQNHRQFSYSVSGMLYDTHHYQVHNRQNNYNLNTLFSFRNDVHEVNAALFAYKTKIQIPVGLKLNQPAPPVIITDNHSQIENLIVSLQDQWFMSDTIEWKNSLVVQSSSMDGVVNVPYDSHQNALLWHSLWQYQERIEAGVELEGQTYSLLNSLQDNDVRANIGSVFTRIFIPLPAHLTATLGGRLAKQNLSAKTRSLSTRQKDHSHVFVNEQGLEWQANPNLKLYLRRDMNYRFAKANEKIWVNSNITNLKTQTGVSYETGVNWQLAKQDVRLMLYRLDLDNEIAFDPQPTGDAPFGKMYNLPPTTRTGVDFSLSRELKPNRLKGIFQLSYVDAYFRKGLYKNNQIPMVSPVKASLTLDLAALYGLNFSFTEVYNDAFYPAYDLMNQGSKMPAYWISNINIVKRFKTCALSLQVNNVFDKHFTRFASFYSGKPATVIYYPDDGLNLLLKLDVNLDV